MSEYYDVHDKLFSAVKRGDLKEVKDITKYFGAHSYTKCNVGLDLVCSALISKNKLLMKYLIEEGYANFSEFHGYLDAFYNILHLAVIHADLEIIKMLTEGIKIDTLNFKGKDPFFSLAYRVPVDEEFSRILNFFLIESDRNILLDDNYSMSTKGSSLLHAAVLNKNVDLVALLLKRQANFNMQDDEGSTPLHLCAMYGNSQIISMLLKRGADYEIQDRQGRTPLYLAAIREDIEIIKILLKRTLRNDYSLSSIKDDVLLLYCAVVIGKRKIVEMLLREGANINFHWKGSGKSPFHVAVERKFADIVELLLEKGANPNQNFPTFDFTALHIAAEIGHEGIVKLLLEYNADPTSVNFYKETPLHLAIGSGSLPVVENLLNNEVSFTEEKQIDLLFIATQKGNLEIVKFLCDFFSTNSTNIIEYYPVLYVACYHGYEEIVKMFLQKKGIKPDSCYRNCLSPLHAAAERGQEKIVELLIKHGAKESSRIECEKDDEPFSTPLLVATKNGHERIIKMLLHHGANIEAKIRLPSEETVSDFKKLLVWGSSSKNKSKLECGYTALHFASKSGKKTIVDLLLQNGVDVNVKTDQGETSLGFSILAENVKIIRSLLEAGANPNIQVDNLPALFNAITKKNSIIVDLLLNHNASVNFETMFYSNNFGNKSGYTPLHVAVLEGTPEIVEMLLKKGASIDVETEQDFPLHCAIRRGHKEIVNKLIKYGAKINSVCDKKLTPFFHAILEDKLEILKLLLVKGATFEMTFESIPLLCFLLMKCPEADEEMVEFILHCGADVKSVYCNLSVLQYELLSRSEAFVYNFDEWKCQNTMLKLILEYGAEPNFWLEEHGKYILHYATDNCTANVVNLLLEYNANLNLTDNRGNTPYKSVVTKLESRLQNYSEEFDIFENDQKRLNRSINIDHHYQFWIPILEITRSMTQVLTLLKSAKKNIHKQNLDLLNNPYIQPYYEYCQKEIEKLQNTLIGDSVNYFDILVASDIKLAAYARNVEIMNALRYHQCHKQFPDYAKFLTVCRSKGMKRKELMEKNYGFFKKALDIELPILVIYKIFNYLCLCDLIRLSKVCKPIKVEILEELEDSYLSSDEEF